MKEFETYNNYLMEGIIDGTIKEVLRDRVRCYLVRRPFPNEVVMGYTNFSSVMGSQTDTQLAGQNDV